MGTTDEIYDDDDWLDDTIQDDDDKVLIDAFRL